jgi:hypothetical protein
MRLILKPLDVVIVLLSLALTVFSGIYVYATPQNTVQVRIRGQSGEWVFPLDAEESVSIPGVLGETRVALHKGTVRVLSSPCTNQTCVTSGHIQRAGQWLACLPNEVFVVIESAGTQNETDLDAATW